jgi:hypothetical protein
MSNTKISPQLATLDGPVIASNALCQENFPCLWHEALLRPDKSTRGSGRSGASPRGFDSGDSNRSKLTDVFVTMQLTGPDMSSRLVKPIPIAINLCVFEA